ESSFYDGVERASLNEWLNRIAAVSGVTGLGHEGSHALDRKQCRHQIRELMYLATRRFCKISQSSEGMPVQHFQHIRRALRPHRKRLMILPVSQQSLPEECFSQPRSHRLQQISRRCVLNTFGHYATNPCTCKRAIASST